MIGNVLPIFIGSSLGLVVLGLLFYLEDRRGKRFALSIRRWADEIVDRCIVRWHTLLLQIGAGFSWVGIHFVIHNLLTFSRVCVRRLEAYIVRLQRRNRRLSKSIRAARTRSHLTAIAMHKHETALSQEEKQELKEKSLGG